MNPALAQLAESSREPSPASVTTRLINFAPSGTGKSNRHAGESNRMTGLAAASRPSMNTSKTTLGTIARFEPLLMPTRFSPLRLSGYYLCGIAPPLPHRHALSRTMGIPVDIIRLALIEDDRQVREGLAQLIGASPGHRCVAACASAEEALAQLPALKPEIVLMDIGLPGMSGIDCIRELKRLLLRLLAADNTRVGFSHSLRRRKNRAVLLLGTGRSRVVLVPLR
jgi:CheY-like chemotaxis protein